MKNIIPIILAIALINMSCGKSKKEEPVTIEQENQNVEQSQASKTEEQKREVGVITTEYGDLINAASPSARFIDPAVML